MGLAKVALAANKARCSGFLLAAADEVVLAALHAEMQVIKQAVDPSVFHDGLPPNEMQNFPCVLIPVVSTALTTLLKE